MPPPCILPMECMSNLQRGSPYPSVACVSSVSSYWKTRTFPASRPCDMQERMANMLNDCEISPTNYMIAFLRQRGWQMPEITMRIPNVIPEVDPIAARVGPSLPSCQVFIPRTVYGLVAEGFALPSWQAHETFQEC